MIGAIAACMAANQQIAERMMEIEKIIHDPKVQNVPPVVAQIKRYWQLTLDGDGYWADADGNRLPDDIELLD